MISIKLCNLLTKTKSTSNPTHHYFIKFSIIRGLSLLTTDKVSLDTRQNVICLPINIVCSTRRVNNGSDHGN